MPRQHRASPLTICSADAAESLRVQVTCLRVQIKGPSHVTEGPSHVTEGPSHVPPTDTVSSSRCYGQT
eukprot:1705804-Rhodomonas_salina.1